MALSPAQGEKNKIESTFAALDLGSNSFHLVVAHYEHGELTIIDRLREMVRLGAGLDKDNTLSLEAKARALACLARFGQRLKGLPGDSVRVVGTNALRQAEKCSDFLSAAENLLGHPIEVIAGREEARLIYLGVANGLATGDEARIVFDIGGGSTEVILGKGFDPIQRESIEIGCVSLSHQFFATGKITRKRIKKAELHAELALQPIVKPYLGHGWATAIGCSGTIKVIRAVVQAQGWSDQGITRESLNQLKEHILEIGDINNVVLPGLSDDRKPVLAGGLAVLSALFDLFQLSRLDVSDMALREGVLYDLIGRREHEDVRESSVHALSRRWNIDEQQALSVEHVADKLFDQVEHDLILNNSNARHYLGWAARLHEIGLSISHSRYHKHGAYILANADLAGFSRREQKLLSALVLGHRRKLVSDIFSDLPPSLEIMARPLCLLLRIAVLLCRSRTNIEWPVIAIDFRPTLVGLEFEHGWLESHPLTQTDLEQEAGQWKALGMELVYS